MWTLWFGRLGFLQPFHWDGNKGKKGWAWWCDIISQTVSGSESCWLSVRYAASEWEQMGHLGLSRSQQKAWACKASRWAWSSLCWAWATMPSTSLGFWTRWIVHSVGQCSFLIPGMWFEVQFTATKSTTLPESIDCFNWRVLITENSYKLGSYIFIPWVAQWLMLKYCGLKSPNNLRKAFIAQLYS